MTTPLSSVKEAMDKTDTPSHSVDYYYLEAMKYLKCGHSSDDSGNEEDGYSCHHFGKSDDEDDDNSKKGKDNNEDSTGRGRSWSHSHAAEEFESGTLGQLPKIDGKLVGSRLKNRRFSDGMLLKPNMKVTADGHVRWADECKKELTRYRPRKTYTRAPTLHPCPRKSILKNGSEESLVIHKGTCSDNSEDEED